jgi:hypothetical protein
MAVGTVVAALAAIKWWANKRIIQLEVEEDSTSTCRGMLHKLPKGWDLTPKALEEALAHQAAQWLTRGKVLPGIRISLQWAMERLQRSNIHS